MSFPSPTRQISPLLHLPYDVSHLILKYLIPPGIHIFLHQGRLRVSECFGADVKEMNLKQHYSYSEPRREGIVEAWLHTPPKWARRLMLSWGEHWKCEEAMLGEDEREGGEGTERNRCGTERNGCGTVDAMLRTCKTL
jgi:hypothetical protein